MKRKHHQEGEAVRRQYVLVDEVRVKRKAAEGAASAPAPENVPGRVPVSYKQGWVMDEYKGAIRKEDIGKELLKDCERAFTKKSFWVDAGAEPRCAFERYALDIFNEHVKKTPTAGYGDAIPAGSGAEWWVQIRGRGGKAEEALGFHWDRDEELAVDQGVVVCPAFLTVTYLSDAGAPTAVIDVPPLTAKGTVRLNEMYVSHPLAGKHVVFKGNMLHGCPPEMMKLVKLPSYTRITLLVNVWLGHRPSQISPAPLALVSTFTTPPTKGLFTHTHPTPTPPTRIPPGSSSPITGFSFGRKKAEDHEVWVPIPPKKAANLGTFAITCPKGSKVIRK
eukprot:TRINITY_DN4270_c0_g1_i1.p1 TRINITY_DN4270_c0_g1~~TRINITY_DN4270_c0_g1_i1.p1  ORF type:complete len:334 (+),score=95.28 TRINITY_DN4270_c0_g1_i1:36-1037(+)